MKIINPQKLKKGDLISVVSPSSGAGEIFPHRIEEGINFLKSMGFRVKIEKNALKRSGWVSGTVKERVEDIHSAFKDKQVSAVICTIGGNHSNQLLKYLDYQLIRENPKIFLGYSDITVLHGAFYKKAGIRTFYGPCIISEFGEYPEMFHFTKKYFEKCLMEGEIGQVNPSNEWTDEFSDWFNVENYKKSREMYSNSGYEWWSDGYTTGKIFGGAIPSINHLLGTEYEIDFKNKILFLDLPEGNNPGENLPLADVDAYLADLFNVGIFEYIKGLIIGRPYGYRGDKEKYKQLRNIVDNYTKGKGYPILFNADFGHTSPMITIPIGAEVELNSKDNKFEIKNVCVVNEKS